MCNHSAVIYSSVLWGDWGVSVPFPMWYKSSLASQALLNCTQWHFWLLPGHIQKSIVCRVPSAIFNCAVTLYCKQFVSVWADTVSLGHLLFLAFILCLLKTKRTGKRKDPWKSKLAHLIAPNVFSVYAALPYHGNCIPEPNTHPLVIWHRLFDAPCVCAYPHICVCLQDITAGKPNLPAIVLIKVVFLRLALNSRQHQLHTMTGTWRGRLPQPADTRFELPLTSKGIRQVITG